MCLIKRQPNITNNKQYKTGSTSFWMNQPYTLIYVPYQSKMKKPANPDITCIKCSKTYKDNCTYDNNTETYPSEWIITSHRREDCLISLQTHENVTEHRITINPISNNLHQIKNMQDTYQLYVQQNELANVPDTIHISCNKASTIVLQHSHLEITIKMEYRRQRHWSQHPESTTFHIQPKIEYQKNGKRQEEQHLWECNPEVQQRTIQKNEEKLYGKLFTMKTTTIKVPAYLITHQKTQQPITKDEAGDVAYLVIRAKRRSILMGCKKLCPEICTATIQKNTTVHPRKQGIHLRKKRLQTSIYSGYNRAQLRERRSQIL